MTEQAHIDAAIEVLREAERADLSAHLSAEQVVALLDRLDDDR